MLGSDVIYSEGAVGDLLSTLQQLCGRHTTAILSGELRNGKNLSHVLRMISVCLQHFKSFLISADAVLEYFLESAIKDFSIGQVDQMEFHPEYRSHRVVIYILVKRSNEECTNDN